MNALHLIWIVPLCMGIGALLTAIVAGGYHDE